MEIDRARAFRLLMYFLLMVGVLGVIYIYTNLISQGESPFTSKHLLLFILLSIPLAFLTDYVVEKTSIHLVNALTGGNRKCLDRGEMFSADLQRARHSKRQGYYEEALAIVNDFLGTLPDFPEALFLKAEIQWTGFNESGDAKHCLKKVIELVPDSERLNRWAQNYYNDIVQLETDKKENPETFARCAEKNRLAGDGMKKR